MNAELSELEYGVETTRSLHDRIDGLNDMAMQLLNTDISRTIELAEKARNLVETEKGDERYLKGLAVSMLALGAAHYRHTNHELALSLSQEAIELCEQLGELRSMTFGLNTVGATYITLGEYDKALETHQKSLRLRESIHDEHGTATSLMNIGNVYYLLGDYARALDFYLKSLALRERIQDETGIGTSLANIANVYSSIGDSEQALEYLLKSAEMKQRTENKQGLGQTFSDIAAEYLKRNELTSALDFAHRSYDVSVQIGNKVGQSSALHIIARTEEKSCRFELALNYYRRSYELRRSIGYHKGEIESGIAMGTLKCRIGDAPEAETTLMEALRLAEELRSKPLIFEVYSALATCYEMQENYNKALWSFRKFHEIKEEVFNEDSARKTKNLQVLHAVEHAKHEAEIYRLRSVELQSANEEILRQQNILADQTSELQLRNEELLALDHEKNELLAIVAHDLKNPLTGIIINTSNVQRNQSRMTTDDILDQVQKIEVTAKRMKEITLNLLDIHAIETSMVHLAFEAVDVRECLQQVTERISSRAEVKQIALHLDVDGAPVLALADRNAVLQVVENLVSNAVKYSPAGRTVTLRCWQKESNLIRIEITDEGPGIPHDETDKLFKKFSKLSTRPTAGEESTGLGLSIVKKLVDAMRGQVWCEDAIPHGAVFIVELPSVTQ